jgi:solute carrier family 35, member E3
MDGGNPAGALVAAISVVSSGMQQILCRSMQQKHGLSANELLSNTAPAQAVSLLALGPWLDARLGGRGSVFDYAWSGGAARLLALSCAAAVAVNVSQFACLGRFSAVSFQVRE